MFVQTTSVSFIDVKLLIPSFGLEIYNYANRIAPSRNIATGFSVIEHLRFICSGGSFDGSKMYVNNIYSRVAIIMI